MRQHEKELEQLGVNVVIVTFEAGFLGRAYVEETGLKWPLLVDEPRGLYQAFGMLTAGFWDIWGPSTWLAYLKEMAKGKSPKKRMKIPTLVNAAETFSSILRALSECIMWEKVLATGLPQQRFSRLYPRGVFTFLFDLETTKKGFIFLHLAE